MTADHRTTPNGHVDLCWMRRTAVRCALPLMLLSVATCGGGAGSSPTILAPTPTAPSTPVPTASASPALPISTPTPVLSGMPFEQVKVMTSQLSYDDLFRNNEQHVGVFVYYQAKVIQVVEAGGGRYQLRANVTRGEYFWDDTVFLRYAGRRLLEDDIIEFLGEVNGLITYESVLGGQVTIPDISVIQARLMPMVSGPVPTVSRPIPTVARTSSPEATRALSATGTPTQTETPSPTTRPTPTVALVPAALYTQAPSPTPAPGYARTNPADIGTALSFEFEYQLDYEPVP